MENKRFELLEWHDRRYQHVEYLNTTKHEAEMLQKTMNEGYTGPRFVIREVSCLTTH